MKMKSSRPILFSILVVWPSLIFAQVTVLHSFSPLVTETNIQGSYPVAGLALSGNTLYGTTPVGGASSRGMIFKINTDGSDYAGLYSFTGGSDGSTPGASLILVGDMLYGTTEDGGLSTNGTIFAINTNGSDFATLYSFSALDTNSDNGDGANPSASLVFSGNTLYGTAQAGGVNGAGTVFGLTTNGSFFTNLYSFTGGNDGGTPLGGLTLSNGVLYGTASEGGRDFDGTIFAINTNGSGFTNLYDFTGGSDGGAPGINLVLSGDWLYGTTGSGGADSDGNVFEVLTNGLNFTNLYEFTGGDDGSGPGGLVLMNDRLYGTAVNGGAANHGTVFALNTDGSDFAALYSFSALNSSLENSDGTTPEGSLVAAGNEVFGMARYGGQNDFGTVFGVSTNGAAFFTLLSFDPYLNGLTFDGNSDGASPQGGVVLSGDMLFGTTTLGGGSGYGTIFSMQTNGSNFATLHSFAGQADGSGPAAGLILSGNLLYGAAEHGGLGDGVLFSIETNGSDFTVIYTFSSLDLNFENSDGAEPVGSLLLSNGILYGTTQSGGAAGNGTVFSVALDGLQFTNLHSFSTLHNQQNTDGANPVAGLVLSNGILYGTTPNGGAAGVGTVFALGIDGSSFTTLYSFTNGSDGANPMEPLLLTNGMLYGTAGHGGSQGDGTIFGINVDGSGFTNVYTFTGSSDGGNPMGGLVGDRVYVPAANGGEYFAGAIFSINLDGAAPMDVSLPGGASGAYPNGEMGLTANGTVFVAAGREGAANNGAILAVVQPGPVTATLESSSGTITIPSGGSGVINVPEQTSFNYSFYVNSNMNPADVSIAGGPPPSGLNVPGEDDSTGVWHITGDFAQPGAYTATLEVQQGGSTYYYTINIVVCSPPTITNVVAASTNGLLNPGDQIIITGTSLSSATQVLFNYSFYGDTNGVPGTVLQLNSDNQITVTVPTGASTSPIGVFTSCGYFVTVPCVIIGAPPVITFSSPALMPGNIFSFNFTGPPGTYEFRTSPDLVHWTPFFTTFMVPDGDPSVGPGFYDDGNVNFLEAFLIAFGRRNYSTPPPDAGMVPPHLP